MNAAARIVEVRVPDMGNFKDVAVIDVLVKPGETIEPEAPLVTLETEKATMDVPSTASGVIEKVHVAKGGKVSAGDLIATVRSESAGDTAGPSASGGGAGQSVAQNTDNSAAAPSVAAERSAGAAGAAAVSGGRGAAAGSPGAALGGPTGGAAPASSGAASAAPAASRPAGAPQSAGMNGQGPIGGAVTPGATSPDGPIPLRTDLPPINEPGFSRAHAGPSVRKFARELGVDLTVVGGHGFKGRITHEDVKNYVKSLVTSAPKAGATAASGGGAAAKSGGAPGGSALPTIPPVDFAAFGPIETKPLSRIQKISGPRLHASWVNIPHVTQFDEADITELEETRAKLKDRAAQAGIKLTPLAFIVRACVKALQQFPQFNASLDPSGANLILKKYIHVGFAADTPNGLVVPVVHDADRKDIYEIARKLGELSEKARAGKLSVAEMQGGCFTISSLGGIGGTAFTPIINAPEVAILGVSRSTMKPVYRDGPAGQGFVPRLMLPLSLSYDHRVIDGAAAARFTTYLGQILADARGLLEAVP